MLTPINEVKTPIFIRNHRERNERKYKGKNPLRVLTANRLRIVPNGDIQRLARRLSRTPFAKDFAGEGGPLEIPAPS
jgi:hypothetical protein